MTRTSDCYAAETFRPWQAHRLGLGRPFYPAGPLEFGGDDKGRSVCYPTENSIGCVFKVTSGAVVGKGTGKGCTKRDTDTCVEGCMREEGKRLWDRYHKGCCPSAGNREEKDCIHQGIYLPTAVLLAEELGNGTCECGRHG